jgi:glycosyltransferase involved in cell wall biosynthesis
VSRQERLHTGRVLVPRPHVPVEPLPAPPTFSIVITAYQAAETIGDAVRSALEQVHPAHEVIVVDDGSTDDLEGALRRFDGQIRLIRKENGGGASARNAGARAATADFMAILDADDAYHPRRLEALASLAVSRPDLDLVTTDARFVVDGEGVGSFLAHNPFAVENQRTAIYQSCFVGGWPAVRRRRLRAIGGFDESFRIGYDWDCWLRLILDGALAGLVDEPYYDYVLHPGSLAASRVSSLWERVRLLEKAADNPSLESEERPVLMRSLRTQRTQAVLAEIRTTLFDSGPRYRLPRFALSRGIGARARALAAVALAAPPLARRIIPQDQPPEERFTERLQ